MEVDSLSSSHPVSTHVENPVQIQEMFDDVSYDKVSLIRSSSLDFRYRGIKHTFWCFTFIQEPTISKILKILIKVNTSEVAWWCSK